MAILGLPGGFIVYRGHLFTLNGQLCASPVPLCRGPALAALFGVDLGRKDKTC